MFDGCTIFRKDIICSLQLTAVQYHIFGILILIAFVFSTAYAHVDVDVEQYNIDVGWMEEPPVVGFRNAIVFDISERGETEGVKKGVTNAFKNWWF